MSDEVEDMPGTREQRLLQVLPAVSSQPGDLDETLALQGCQGGGDALLLSLIVALWMLSPVALFLCTGDKLAAARRDMGLSFAIKAFLCRMVEMPAAAAGIVWGSLPRRTAPEMRWRSSLTAPDMDKGAG